MEVGIAILISNKIESKTNIRKKEKGYYVIVISSIQGKSITLNIYVPNVGAPKANTHRYK